MGMAGAQSDVPGSTSSQGWKVVNALALVHVLDRRYAGSLLDLARWGYSGFGGRLLLATAPSSRRVCKQRRYLQTVFSMLQYVFESTFGSCRGLIEVHRSKGIGVALKSSFCVTTAVKKDICPWSRTRGPRDIIATVSDHEVLLW